MSRDTGVKFWDGDECSTWRPDERLSISQWTENYRVLGDQSEEKGPLRLRRTPYIIPIMDRVQNLDTETIVFCKPAQIAGTEGAISIVGYYAHQEPCPIMVVLADKDTAEYMSESRIQKMFTDSPEMRDVTAGATFVKEKIKLNNGTSIYMGWASSVAKLASRPIKVLVLDEIDKPGYFIASREAGPTPSGRER